MSLLARGFWVFSGCMAAWAASAAQQCTLAGTLAAKVSIAGTITELPVLAADCAAVKVVAGAVTACVDDDRNRLKCRTFTQGAVLTEQVMGRAGNDQGILTSLINLLKGSASSSSAESRGSIVDLPSGSVLFLSDQLDVDFTSVSLLSTDGVDFVDGESNALIGHVERRGTHTVDTRLFRPGRTYRWIFAGQKRSYLAPSGQFKVADEALLDQAEQKKQELLNSGADPQSRAVMMAAWLSSQGLGYDAKEALRSSHLIAR